MKPPSGPKKTNPTCRGVASGEAGFKANFRKAQNERKLIYYRGLRK